MSWLSERVATERRELISGLDIAYEANQIESGITKTKRNKAKTKIGNVRD